MAKRKGNKSIFGEWGELIRWKNTIVALLCVMVGFILGDEPFPQPGRLLVYLVLGFIFTGGNVLNDFADVASDRIAHPKRPLPSGTIQQKSALFLGLGLMGMGLFLNFLGMKYYGLIPALIAFSALVLLVFYDFLGSRIPLLGNIIIALLSGMVFIFVGSAQGLTHGHIFAAGYSALITLAREIVKDIADRPADESVGIKTISAVIGDKRSANLASLCMAIIIPMTIVPYFTGVFNEWYLGLVILFVDLPIALLAWLLPGNISPAKAKKYARDMKWIIIGGMIALFIGGIAS
jgi:geranylgeranylglycerol-phosphate geranylgeranyltransferase